MNRWSIAFYDRSDLTAPVATPTLNRLPTFKASHNDAGDGGVTLQLSDPETALVDVDQILVFLLDGDPVHAIVVEELDYDTLAPSLGERTLTVKGRGVLALLEEADIEPATGTDRLPVEEVRQFNWRGFDYDDSDWDFATEYAAVTAPTTFWTGLPQDFPDYGDPDGTSVPKYIGPSTGDEDDAPDESIDYYRRTVTTASPITFDEFAGADNEGKGYVDGIEALDLLGFGTTRHIDGGMQWSTGEHLLAWWAHNYFDDGSPGGNPTMLIYSACALSVDGLISEVLTFSGSLTKIKENPGSPPGMAATAAMKILLDEAQAATPARCASFGYDFTAPLGSNGETMDEIGDLAGRVGDDLLTFVRQLVDSGYCDVRMKLEADGLTGIALTFQMFKPGTLGSTTTITPDFLTIHHKKRAAPVTSALVRWRDALTSYESGIEPAKRAFIQLQQQPSASSAAEVAQAIVDARASGLVAVTATIDAGVGPNANEPFTGLFPGDTMPIEMIDGSTSDEVVQDIVFGTSEAGHPRWQIGIKDRILDADQRAQTIQKRATPGMLAGQSGSPSLLSPQSSGKGSQYRLLKQSWAYTGDRLDTPDKQIDRTADVFFLEIRLAEVWTEDVTVVLRINNHDTPHALECTVPTGDLLAKAWLAVGTTKVTTSDWYMLGVITPAAPPRFTATLAFR